MTACHEFLEMMSTSLDHLLPSGEQARLDNHVAECPECRAAWKELQWTHSRIKGLEAVEPPPWLTSKIMAKIRAEAAPQASFWRRFILPIVLKPQLQVASILLLAATGFFLLRSQRPGTAAFQELKQQQPPAALQSQPSTSVGLGGKPIPGSRIPPSETQAPRSEGLNQFRVEDSKNTESAFAPPPPLITAPTKAEPLKPAMAKQERDRMRLERPAAAPSAPSALAGAAVGTVVAVAAESEAAPARQAKKSSKGADAPTRTNRADEEAKEKMAESTGQLLDQAGPKDKSDAPEWVILLAMPDPRDARPMLERELARTGATVLPRRGSDSPRMLRASLDSRRLPDLLIRLAKLGKVLAQPDVPVEKPSRITLSISW